MFSVIIPLYNKAKTIERAIASVLAQTDQTFELIVVDDGSTDRGAEIVRSIPDPRIRLLQQANGGVSKARNTGIEAAKYDYVTFLDADDEYLPEFLETMRKLIEKYPQAGIYGTSYCFQYPDGTREKPLIRGIPDHFEGILENYFEIASSSAPIFCSDTVCIKRQVILDIGNFPVGVAAGEDLLTWARICASYPLAYRNHSAAVYHLGKTSEYLPTRVPAEDDYVGDSLHTLYRTRKISGLRRYISFWHKNRASCYLRLNMRIACIGETLKALFYFPSPKLFLYLVLACLPEFFTKKVFEIHGR